MRLWAVHDPYGIAVARRVLLWAAMAIGVMALMNLRSAPESIGVFEIIIACVVACALLLEPLVAFIARR